MMAPASYDSNEGRARGRAEGTEGEGSAGRTRLSPAADDNAGTPFDAPGFALAIGRPSPEVATFRGCVAARAFEGDAIFGSPPSLSLVVSLDDPAEAGEDV